MKKILSLLTALSMSSTSISVISCEQIESFPSKHANVNTTTLEKFFLPENNLKPYNTKYMELINNSWEHIGFNNNISTHKIDHSIVDISEKELLTDFFNSLVNLYTPSKDKNNLYDFTGLTFYIENIFLNLISVDVNLELTVNSDIAITIKKGWKTVGKILLTLENDIPYNINETIYFINKIFYSTKFVKSITKNEDKKTIDVFDFIINSNLNEKNFDEFFEDITIKSKLISNLSFAKKQFSFVNDKDILYLTFNNFKYKIIS
ncbi:hypothetical protein [Spiroplasma turonicum]|uniref:Lipoprotein n=1 Tax=Spiroplasma turonicum TaxID=216946 RepID=A0A0K1P608_9MOLU|nr:hypothetical protein [Spiroplasma turonicum]AKU79748.1 hypothetical protein STURON_00502 [Spiroplasma turonicum]ALX70766.1 hypothetical protein STURO_v1c05000 [Spiroplasma turonicum]